MNDEIRQAIEAIKEQQLVEIDLNWYQGTIELDDIKQYIRANINSVSRSFVAIGYYLKYVRDNELYAEDGYQNIWEFAKDEFGIGKSSASQFMSINDKFSKDGNSPILLEQYKDFSSSKLAEMLTMTEEQLEKVNPKTTIVEIREIKKPVETVLTSEQESAEPITIDDLDFTVRTYNCLKRSGIDTIEQLCNLTRDDVASIRNFSHKCLDEIYMKLSGIGRCLKPDYIPDTVNANPEIVDYESEIVNDVDEAVLLPCDTCGWDIKGCCDYDNEDMYCIDGDAWKPKEMDPAETVEADIIETEYEDDNDDRDEPEIISPEHYTYRDVDDELDKLMEYVENFREDNSMVPGRRKAKMRLDAIILLDKEMKLSMETNRFEPEQPELPILRNNDQRKEFIDAYDTWPVWIETKDTGERYYRYDFDNGDSIVVKVYYCKIFNYKATNLDYEDRFSDGWGKEEYYLLETGKYFKDCETNKSSLIEYLKDLQKKVV